MDNIKLPYSLVMIARSGVAIQIGIIFLTVVLIAFPFIPGANLTLAAMVIPLIHNIIIAQLALVGVIVVTFLGFKSVSASIGGAAIKLDKD